MPEAALHEVLRVAGWPDAAAEAVAVAGTDPVLATRFRIGCAGVAAIGAAALAAAELWSLRAGRARQRIAVDLRRVTAALASSRYLRIDGMPPKSPFDAVSGIYAAGDGRAVMLHCNFPQSPRCGAPRLGTTGGGVTGARGGGSAVGGRWSGA